jgi:hypothetical protein
VGNDHGHGPPQKGHESARLHVVFFMYDVQCWLLLSGV